jgi:hypothetical protein
MGGEKIGPIKENMMPSDSGYRLKDIMASDPGLERQVQLKLQRLLVPDEDDELKPFLDYLKWIKAKFPMGHPSYRVVHEQAIRKFRKVQRHSLLFNLDTKTIKDI